MSLFGDEDVMDNDTNDDVAPTSEGLLDPKAMSFCIGHDEQEKFFIDLYEKGSLPHAMTFSGIEGIGKTTMAFRLARFLLKNGKGQDDGDSLFGDALPQEISSLDVSADDPVFSRIASGGHGDLLHIHRLFDKAKGKLDATLKVQSLRKIEPFLRKTSSEGGWRIVIVEDADTMNRNAQNAILKILEEPPANVLIMLIAHRPGMLIPTIHSRSRVIQFSSLSAENMAELMRKNGYDLSINEIETLSDLSEGSVGQALKYSDNGGIEMLNKVLEHIALSKQGQTHKIHELASSLGSPAQDVQYRMFVDVMQWVFRKMLFLKAKGETEIPVYFQNDTVQSILDNSSIENLISLSDNLKNHFSRVEFSNLDRRDAVRSAFLMISE